MALMLASAFSALLFVAVGTALHGTCRKSSFVAFFETEDVIVASLDHTLCPVLASIRRAQLEIAECDQGGLSAQWIMV
jgi:hypothetical protein